MMDLQQRHTGAARPEETRDDPRDHHVVMLARLIAEGRLGPDVGVTCQGREDGAGAQAMGAISAMAVARSAGCKYRHTPFKSVAHAEGAREEWARRWESFFNLGDGEASVPDDADLVPLSVAVLNPDAYAGRPIVIVEQVFGLPQELDAPVRDALRGALRAKYWSGGKSAIPSHRGPAGCFTAAFHLRRGDVDRTRNANRYVGDTAALRQIARLQEAVAPFDRTLTINLYSEGSAADFGAFADAGCNLHISADAFETFHNMVTADILMIAPSTFSRLAGLLSHGIVVGDRRRSFQLSGWLRRRATGDMPIKSLRRALLHRMGWLERQSYHARRWRRRLFAGASNMED